MQKIRSWILLLLFGGGDEMVRSMAAMLEQRRVALRHHGRMIKAEARAIKARANRDTAKGRYDSAKSNLEKSYRLDF